MIMRDAYLRETKHFGYGPVRWQVAYVVIFTMVKKRWGCLNMYIDTYEAM